MNIKIEIRTPKGQAKKASKNIRGLLLGIRRVKSTTYISPKDDSIVLDIDGSVKDILAINKNVSMFDAYVKMAFQNKLAKAATNKFCNEQEKEELHNMLDEHTTIKVVKKATAEELVELNKTWFERIKEKFKREKNE